MSSKEIVCCTCDTECPIHGEGGEAVTLTVERLPEYGKDLYSAENALSRRFLLLLKTQKTFTRSDLERIKALGYSIRNLRGESL